MNLSGEILALKNCSLTIKTLGGIEHFSNIHKTARTIPHSKEILQRILDNYKKGKRGPVNNKL